MKQGALTLEELQQAAVAHELGDDVDGSLHRTHGVQLDELRVAQLLHDLRLPEEVLRVHGTWQSNRKQL